MESPTEDKVCPASRQCHPQIPPWCLLLQGCAFSLCVPNPGTSFKDPLDALKEVDDDSMLGLGYNHLIKDSQWELQEAIFCSTYQEYLKAEGVTKEEIPR